MSRDALLRLLGELETAQGAAATAYVPACHGAFANLEALLLAAAAPDQAIAEVNREAAGSPTGAVLFWGLSHKVLVLPPFPLATEALSPGYRVGPLRSLLRSGPLVALVLVRLGSFAIGVFRGEELLSSKVGTGLVHSRHRQGGSSQRRFERHREKQIEAFYARLCAHARERMEPYLGQLDYLLYGGERHTVLELRRQCRFLASADDRVVGRLLNVREPRQASLVAAINTAWSSQVTTWTE